MIFIRVVRGRRECLNAGFILVVPEHGCFPFSKGIPAPVLQENRNFLATCSFHAIPVLATGESQAVPEIAQAALALLCQTYWAPLYTSYPSSEVPRLMCGTPNQQVPIRWTKEFGGATQNMVRKIRICTPPVHDTGRAGPDRTPLARKLLSQPLTMWVRIPIAKPASDQL
jgi:hypothetical protein